MPTKKYDWSGWKNRPRSYRIWMAMRNRCNNSEGQDYPYYGGRGIRVCKRWDDYLLFLEDMGEPPNLETLDRLNSNGDYCPSNCRWASRRVQSRNRPYCKLNQEKAEEIRDLYRSGLFQIVIARMFGVSQHLISMVVTGKIW